MTTPIASPVSIACDLCGVLTPNGKVGTPEFPETNKLYGPYLCPGCFDTWEKDASDKADSEAIIPTWQEIIDADMADFNPNPDDGKVCYNGAWESARGYYMAEYD